MLTLSIILPAYNEDRNIIRAVKTSEEACLKLGISFEIVVVNDGSDDTTGIVLEELRNEVADLRIITHETNKGLGAAIRTGIKAARGEYCILLPADSPLGFDILKPFLDKADNADVVIGYRTEKPGYRWYMRWNSKLYHWLLRTIFGFHYRDVNWIHLYRRDIFRHIDLEFAGIVMEAEVVLKAHILGLRISEIPCPMQERLHGRPSAGRPKVMIRTGWDLLRLIWKGRTGGIQGRTGKGLFADEN